jgi:hypothetical protein
MIVYNLTDMTPPYRKARKAMPLKVAGVEIPPGKSGDIPDHRLQVADISGWITSMMVSIDSLPEWYQAGRRKKQDKAVAPKVNKLEEVKKVAKVEEPVKSEPDEDDIDTAEITPKAKSKSKKGKK